MDPVAGNQTAEGAALSDDGLVERVRGGDVAAFGCGC
jgi:hypothetical protein